MVMGSVIYTVHLVCSYRRNVHLSNEQCLHNPCEYMAEFSQFKWLYIRMQEAAFKLCRCMAVLMATSSTRSVLKSAFHLPLPAFVSPGTQYVFKGLHH